MSFGIASLIRAVILTALVGHGVANALFDRDQYAGAGPDLLARLDDPFLVQACFGLLVVALLSLRRARPYRVVALGRMPLAVLLIGLQLLVFVALESSERVAVDLFAGGETDVGIFGTGFAAELGIAVGSAVVLALVAEAARRWLGSRDQRGLRIAGEDHFAPPVSFSPAREVLRGAGGVRGPPRSLVRS